MTDAPPTTSVSPVAEVPYPPANLQEFLQLCDGRWMSLRSTFALDDSDDWHTSERGEITMHHQPGDAGSEHLVISDSQGQVLSSLNFAADGVLQRQGDGSRPGCHGHWQLREGGCMEFNIPASDGAVVIERIWFTKANLRLRSTTLVDGKGTPQQANFCSEIRRVSAPSR
ncbi:MAG: phycobiliprotein lyase [Synechococcus sp.]